METVSPNNDWKILVEHLAAGADGAMDELNRRLRNFRYFFYSRLRNDEGEECYHELIMAVIDGIRRGLLREPERLIGYASTISHRIVASRIKILYAQRQTVAFDEVPPICDVSPNPERKAILIEQRTIARRILDSLGKRDREVLIRFYMNEETAARIQHELGLTETQFRLIKSRAKSRFSAMLVRGMNLHTRKAHPYSPKTAQDLGRTA